MKIPIEGTVKEGIYQLSDHIGWLLNECGEEPFKNFTVKMEGSIRPNATSNKIAYISVKCTKE